MDEPWELGQGWSKKLVEKMGKDKVTSLTWTEFEKLVESHGKKMQFWADVLLENPENTKLLPNSASPIIWGYEPSHPFLSRQKQLPNAVFNFALLPALARGEVFRAFAQCTGKHQIGYFQC